MKMYKTKSLMYQVAEHRRDRDERLEPSLKSEDKGRSHHFT